MIIGLIPAAGLSSRMGRPKALLEWNGKPLLASIIDELHNGGTDRVIVVTPPREREESVAIEAVARQAGATTVVPDSETGDMKATILLGLASISTSWNPDGILLTPCDMPGLKASLVRSVLEAARAARGSIVVPRSEIKRGHPVYLPWSIATQIGELPADRGVKHMFDDPSYSLVELSCVDRLEDLDTPEDYLRWIDRTSD